MQPLPCNLVWQTDGRPMSGDIGAGTTRAAVKLGEKVLAAKLPGFIQLAGGTNDRTVNKLKESGLLNTNLRSATNAKPFVAGVAYGSYARVLLSPILEKLEKIAIDEANNHGSLMYNQQLNSRLEETPQLLWDAVAI